VTYVAFRLACLLLSVLGLRWLVDTFHLDVGAAGFLAIGIVAGLASRRLWKWLSA
jgi:hypothetical protein